MKVSLIIPTFNRSLLLTKCLDSLVNQTYPITDYEIIVVDNNSIDNTFDIVNEYIKKYSNLRYFKEKKPGLVNARHTGAKNASFDYLIFTDDDGV